MGQSLKFGNGELISSHTLLACSYLSLVGLKFIHVSKRQPWDLRIAKHFFAPNEWSYSTVLKYSKPYLRTLGNNIRDTLPYEQILFDWVL